MTRASFLFLPRVNHAPSGRRLSSIYQRSGCFVLLLLTLPLQMTVAQTLAFPLHIGDTWEYYWTSQVIIAGDTLMPNGEMYFVFNQHSLVPRFQRYADNKVHIYREDTQTDILWYDFTLSPGDTVSLTDWGADTMLITLSSIVSDTVFGVERMQYRFWVDYYLHLIDDESLLVVTDSLGVTEIQLSSAIFELRGALINGTQYGDITSVANQGGSPERFMLSQNYPNPFNAISNFEFRISNLGRVSLQIYDLLGREAGMLVNEKLSPGTYTVSWDADGLPSGVYFYRIQTEDFTETRRLVLVR